MDFSIGGGGTDCLAGNYSNIRISLVAELTVWYRNYNRRKISLLGGTKQYRQLSHYQVSRTHDA